MELLLMNTAQGLKPMYDEDFEEKKRLKIGTTYRAKVTVPRNYSFHRKYFSMISCAWDLLTERQREFFGNKESFRKTLQVAAGHCERVFNLELRTWVEVPKSIAFDKMSGDEFEDLYRGVRDVLLRVFLKHLTIEQFEETMLNY